MHSTNRSTEFVDIRREEVHKKTMLSILLHFGANFFVHLFRSTPFYVHNFGAHLFVYLFRSTPFRVHHFRSTPFRVLISEHTFSCTLFRSTPLFTSFRSVPFCLLYFGAQIFHYLTFQSTQFRGAILLSAFQREVQISRLLLYLGCAFRFGFSCGISRWFYFKFSFTYKWTN
jgi:ABC-type arginine/histidine transport system permease subunit